MRGKLNLENLVCIATGETCTIATFWAIEDWKWERILGVKQGKFVKSLILVSPKKSFSPYNFSQLSKLSIMSGRAAPAIPILMAVGNENDRLVREVRSIESMVRRARPPFEPEGETDKEKAADRAKRDTLFFRQFPAEADGSALINKSQNLRNMIDGFINLKVVAEDHPWSDLTKK